MEIDLIREAIEIISDLKKTDDYLAAEKLVTTKIKKHLEEGIDIPVIENHLKKLFQYFQNQITITPAYTDSVRYRYIAAFLETLLHSNYWHSWINSPDVKKTG